MSWGSKQTATQLTSITTEQFFAFSAVTLITLNPGESAQCQVAVDFPTTPVDDAVISVYATLDTSTPTYDITPFIQFRLSRLTDPNSATFNVSDVQGFRVGIKRSGTSTTFTSADLSYKKNGLNL